MKRAIWISAVLVTMVGCNRGAAPTPVPIEKAPAETAKVAPTVVSDYSRWHIAKTIPWDSQELTCVAFAPDNRTIAVGGGTQRRTDRDPIETGLLQLWDIETGEARLSLIDPHDVVRSVVFNADGSGFAVSDRRKTKLIDLRSGAARITISEGTHFPISFEPHKKILAIKPDVFFDWLSGQPRDCPVQRPGTNGVFSPDGTLFCADMDLWDLASGRKVAELESPASAASTLSAFSHDSNMIAMGFNLWKATGGQPVWSQPAHKSKFVTGVIFTPDDEFLLVADRSGELRISEVSSGTLISSLAPHDSVEGIAMAPNGTAMVTIGPTADGQIKVWKPETRTLP